MSLTILGKIPLDDPRWLEWRSDLPQRLSAALASSSSKQGDDAWDRLSEVLVHGELTVARYAAVPYVVELGHRVPNVDAGDLWIALGWALSGHEIVGPPVPNELRPAMDAALDLAETRCLEALLSEAWSDDVAVHLAVAALVFAKHPAGRLLAWSGLLDTRMPEGEMHCSACGTGAYVAVVGDGLVTYRTLKASPQAADPTQPRRVSALFPVGMACDSPWRVVGELLRDLGPELPPSGRRSSPQRARKPSTAFVAGTSARCCASSARYCSREAGRAAERFCVSPAACVVPSAARRTTSQTSCSTFTSRGGEHGGGFGSSLPYGVLGGWPHGYGRLPRGLAGDSQGFAFDLAEIST